ncbi:hypothetical protein Ptr902_05765 [Pyrenophora tritici-repentis]|nr:hypothetical protein Ptr902_05765 [Pyrenophora tritici-repentis]
MDPLLHDRMNTQQLSIEPGQQSEDTLDFTLPLPDWPLAAHSQIAEQQPYQPTRIEVPTTFPTSPHDRTQATSWETFPSRQQPSAMIEYNSMYHTPLNSEAQQELMTENDRHFGARARIVSSFQAYPMSSEAQQELMIENDRHFGARARIMARSQAYPMVLQEEQNNHSFNDASLDMYGGTDASTFSFPNARIASDQTLESNLVISNGRDLYGFSSNPGTTQTVLQAAFNPSPFSDYAQDTTSLGDPPLYIQYNDPSYLDLPMNSQQHATERMPLRLSSFNVTYPVPNFYGQGVLAPHFSPLAQSDIMQEHFLQDDGTQAPAKANALLTSFPIHANLNIADSATTYPLSNVIPQYGYHAPDTTVSMSFPVPTYSNTRDLDILSTGPCQVQPSDAMTSHERMRSSLTLASKDILASPDISDRNVKIGGGLDDMHIYRSPEAEREHNRNRKKTHLFNGRFSKLTIFTRPPALDGRWELWQQGTRSRSEDFSDTDPCSLFLISSVVLKPVRNCLDIFEPLHTRQIWSKDAEGWGFVWTLIVVSYSFSLLRWKRVILFLDPSLVHYVGYIEKLLYWRLQLILAELYDNRCYQDLTSAAWYLNVVYEGICSMEPSHLVDQSAKEHLQSALETRTAHIYSMLFPAGSTSKAFRRKQEFQSLLLSWFKSTAHLLRPEYRRSVTASCDSAVLRTQRVLSGPEWCKDRFPNLLAYVPVRFLAAFSLDSEKLCRVAQNIDDPRNCYIGFAEEWIKDVAIIMNPDVPEYLRQSTTPIAFSIGAKIVMDEISTTTYQEGREFEMLYLIIVMSTFIVEEFLTYLRAQVHVREGMFFQDPFPSIPMIMQTWFEKVGRYRESMPWDAKVARSFWDINEPRKRLVAQRGHTS